MAFDLIVRNAQLRQRDGLVDIGVTDGMITALAPRLDGPATREIDAAGRLVTEPFVDCHFHIDKSFFGDVTGRYKYPLKEGSRDAAASFEGEPRSGMLDYEMSHDNVVPIEETWAFKRAYSVDDVASRIGRALDLAIKHGTLAMRMFVDIDSFAGLTALEGAVKARERYGATMDLQICAFPQEGLRTNEESFDLMERALVSGADVVGGLPWVEWTDAAASEHIDYCFELSERFGKDIHFLCDDTPDPMSRTLEMVAAKTIATGLKGRVSSSHNGALRMYPDAHAIRVINMLNLAGVNMVANANVNSLGTYTRVPELLQAGVNVSFGQDDLDNFYYPLGRADMLEVMQFTVHMAHLATPRGFETAFDIGTFNGARTLRLDGYGIAVGNPANMIVFAGHNAHEVLQMQSDRNYVISKGQIVSETHHSGRLQLIEATP